MQKRTRVLAIALVAILLTPAAAATWGALGSVEPDTPQDVSGGRMFLEPNTDLVNRVYFNVVVTHYLSATNPNMASLGEGRYFPGHSFRFDAFYGVWIDCNRDGYIGMADTALLEYRSELLPGDSPCKPESRQNLHNQQGWVSELRWIGQHGGADSADADDLPDGRDNRIISDYGADIWGDRSLPGVDIDLERGACPTHYHATGQVLNRIDCTLAIAVDTEEATGALDGTPLAFQRGPDGQSDYAQPHPLNQETFGDDDAAQSMATVWDCSDERNVGGFGPNQGVAPMDAPLGYKTLGVEYSDEEGELQIAVYTTTNTNQSEYRDDLVTYKPGYYSPGAPGVNSNGNVAGTWNATSEGLTYDCDPETRKDPPTAVLDDEAAKGVYAGESTPDVRQPGKSRVDYTFTFREEQRSGQGKRGEPFDRGVYPVMRSGLTIIASGSRWSSPNYVPGVNANDPEATADSLVRAYPVVRTDLEPAGARYFTFYANLTDTLAAENNLALPSPALGVYGSEWCDGKTTGVVRGFNCNPDEWYLEADGTRTADNEFAVLAGHVYQLRDVDCYDNRLFGGVYASGAHASEAARCPEV